MVWNAEFKDFTSHRENFKDALIVLSVGAYSGIPALRLGFTDKEGSHIPARSDAITNVHILSAADYIPKRPMRYGMSLP